MAKVLVTRISPYDMVRDGQTFRGLKLAMLDLTIKSNQERGTSEASHYELTVELEDVSFFANGLGFYDMDFELVPGRKLRDGGQLLDVTFFGAQWLGAFGEFKTREQAIAEKRASRKAPPQAK